MVELEDLKRGAIVEGILHGQAVSVVDVKWHGSACVELTYKDQAGNPGNTLLYRDSEPQLELVAQGLPWSFDGDGHLFRLAAEAERIRLAYLFDPYMAVHTSLVEPLPHQITAVYGEMLTRQPLRFLLADDPGAGKTIMTGLLLKELLMRGDLHRCLIVCPGSLTEQWQDELAQRFQLPFELLTREGVESARSGNVFSEHNLLICRLDQLSRNEDLQEKLRLTDWDVVVCDEAHKMSASFTGGEVKMTKRYHLGQLLGTICRHFLLLTATPHNGKEEDFQLFLALLDGDRFEGRFRDGVHQSDAGDLMRRMVKEELVKFDGRPLFPERRAYTVTYQLSDLEAALYAQVTEYVREEMNRADRLAQSGDRKRGNTVGFALQTLQRRLASSPEAIYQSLRRRRERLEKRLREERLQIRGEAAAATLAPDFGPTISEDTDYDDLVDETPEDELEQLEEQVVDQATAARTIAELEAETATLTRLERLAQQLRESRVDKKWEELSQLLQGEGGAEARTELLDEHGKRRKLIIFSEHKDTVNYLCERIRTLLGRPEAVVSIHGSMGREDRRKTQELFSQDKDVLILVATDAAGEGINLQRAHLMVNYDLPWNPNRIEQRFGRIHRIGQTEVCHLWNLVASETREGDVFTRLLAKMEEQRKALGGSVFDVLGRCFTDRPLRELLLEAIRYGDSPEIKAKLFQVIDSALDRERLEELIKERALSHETLGPADVTRIRQDMERAETRKLQPHFIGSFFREAFRHLGGRLHERESGRYELTHVPFDVRNRDRIIGSGDPVLARYERVTFHRDLVNVPGKPQAEFLCPGHPVLDATIDLVLERHRDLLKRGTVLVAEADPSKTVKALCILSHAIQDARTDTQGNRHVVSKRMVFAMAEDGSGVYDAGVAPYHDLRPATDEERELLGPYLGEDWLTKDLEDEFLGFAIEHLVPEHLREVRARNEARIEKTAQAVQDRLTKEINYWDHRANELKEKELAGKKPGRMNSGKARARADELEARLKKRMAELEQERQLSAQPPVVVGGCIVVPRGLLDKATGAAADPSRPDEAERTRIDQLAIDVVLAAERSLGRIPTEMSHGNPGYDIESLDPKSGGMRFIEVKGKTKGSDVVTISRTQVIYALNNPEKFILAVVEVDGDDAAGVHYIRGAFQAEPDFAATSVNYDLKKLLAGAEEPC